MALHQSALLSSCKNSSSPSLPTGTRSATERLNRILIDAAAAAVINVASYERAEGRTAQRNGSRSPPLPASRRCRSEVAGGFVHPIAAGATPWVNQALFVVVMESYVHGVSTRTVDDLMEALGADTGIEKSDVSRICAGLDDVAAFRERPLGGAALPYVFVEATYCKARVGRRVVWQAVVAVGVAADGRRQVLGFDVGDTESEPFWTDFLRSLKTRGLAGVQLLVSDAHAGLVAEIAVAFQGASWQRCRVHFPPGVLAKVSKIAGPMVAAIIRTVFVPRGKRQLVETQFEEVVTMLARSHSAAAALLGEARDDCSRSPRSVPAPAADLVHEPARALNKEIKCRTEVVGTFPNHAALLRLAGHVLIDQHDEWDSADRHYFSEASIRLLDRAADDLTIPALVAAYSRH